MIASTRWFASCAFLAIRRSMFEAAGSPAIAVESPMLVALFVLPLVWALVVAIASARRRRGSVHGEESFAETASVAGAVATLGVAIALSVALAQAPKGHVLVQHVAQLARLGQLDLPLAFALAPRTAPFLLLVAVLSCASVLQSVGGLRPNSDARLAWTGIVTAGATLLCVGDSFATVFSGLGILALGIWGVGRSTYFSASVAAIGGHASVLLGFCMLFWSLGGAFGPEGYDPDSLPRFVLVTTSEPSEHADRATLRMTTHAGALVSSDDTDLPNEPIRAPFSISVAPSVLTLRVQGGVATSDVIVPRVALVPGKVHVLVPVGPTASLRALDDQLALIRGTPNEGPSTTRRLLERRSILGVRVPVVVAWLLFGGALIQAFALASRRGTAPLVGLLEAFPPAFLAVRLSDLVAPTSADGALVAALGAGAALVLAARAATTPEPHHAIRCMLSASVAVAVCAVGVGDPGAALGLVCASSLGAAAMMAALEGSPDPRWLGVACASLAGVLPGAGSSASVGLAVSAALALTNHGEDVRVKCVAVACTVAILGAVALGALAMFGVYRASETGTSERNRRGAAAWPVLPVLASMSLLAGVVLGAGTAPFGGSVWPFAWKLVDHAYASLSVSRSGLALALTIAAAALGMRTARSRRSLRADPPWLLGVARLGRLGSSWPSKLEHAAAFMTFSVVTTSTRIEALLARLTERAARRVVVPSGEKLRDVFIVATVASLLLLVLFSWRAG